MMEILFSDSACGSFKMAQHYGKGEYQGGSMGIIISHHDGSKPTKKEIEIARRKAEDEARLVWENATPMGGKTSDIFGFNLMLSVGDISESHPSIKRSQTLEHLYSVYPMDEGHQAAREILIRADENLEVIRERVEKGEGIRIWYSNQPDEMCGLYWFMEQLNGWKAHNVEVLIVKLPEWEADEKGNIIRKNSWAEVAPQEWQSHISLQKIAPPSYIKSCAYHWQELQTENAPLRAMLNGQLVSKSENLYDDFILREIKAEDEEFREAKIVGRVLGKYRLGITDSWVALRIEEMIHAGKLEVVHENDKDMPIYHRVLKKCSAAYS